MKLSMQSKLGKIVAFSFLVIFLIPVFFMFYPSSISQRISLKGIYVRHNLRVVRKFLNTIKFNNGVLVMGTSETGNSLGGNNYWHFLNDDTEIKSFFSVLAGAGRSSNVWIPTILANQQSFSGLKVLYFLNPTYWRIGLNQYHYQYFDRYNSPGLVKTVFSEAINFDVSHFLEPYLNNFGHAGIIDKMQAGLMNYHSYYFFDLKNLFRNGNLIKTRSYKSLSMGEVENLLGGINLEYNVSEDYLSKHKDDGICPVDTSTKFQYQALEAFGTLAKKVGINLVVFIGPYNGILAKKNSPEVIPEYKILIKNVKNLLEKVDIKYIDGSDLSYEPGVFIDAQHHSAYGGWRIEQKVVENQHLF